MAAANFEEVRDHGRGKLKCLVRQLPSQQEELIMSGSNNLPNLGLQFQLVVQIDYWQKSPHQPSQLIYMPQYHKYNTKSFHLKLSPSEYTSYDVFHSIFERNLKDRGGANIFSTHRIGREMKSKIVAHVGGNTNCCQNMEMLVVLSLKLEGVLDGRIQHSWLSNGGMIPASKTSIMQLPERMEIDEDQCLNDECVICFEKLGGKEGGKDPVHALLSYVSSRLHYNLVRQEPLLPCLPLCHANNNTNTKALVFNRLLGLRRWI